MACRSTVVWTLLLALYFARVTPSCAADTNVETQLRMLQQQNELLQSQLHQQQELIESLRKDVAGIHKAEEQRNAEVANEKSAADAAPSSKTAGFNFGKVHLSGEGGV